MVHFMPHLGVAMLSNFMFRYWTGNCYDFFFKDMINLFTQDTLSKAEGPPDCGSLSCQVKNYVSQAEVSWSRSISDKFWVCHLQCLSCEFLR